MSQPFLELWFRAEDGADEGYGKGELRPRLVRAGETADTPSDSGVVERIRAGDERSFDSLYSANFRELWSFARRYVGEAVAEEIVQDVFLRIWERRQDWMVHSTVRAYLFGAVRNRALHYLDHAAVERRASANAKAEQGESSAFPSSDANDMFDAIARAVADLPERQRAAIVLRIQRELSHVELGEALGVSAAAAGMLVRKAETKLRVALKAYLPEA